MGRCCRAAFGADIDEKRTHERALQASSEELKTKAAAERFTQAEEAKGLDRLLSRKALLLQKHDEFTDCIRKLGSLPKEAFEEASGEGSSKQLLEKIDACHKALGAVRCAASIPKQPLRLSPRPRTHPCLCPRDPCA